MVFDYIREQNSPILMSVKWHEKIFCYTFWLLTFTEYGKWTDLLYQLKEEKIF